MRPPSGLGRSGAAFWRRVAGNLPRGFELDEREAECLRLAARQADDLARLEAAIRKEGTMVPGSAGQPVVNPALAEARAGRQAVRALLAEIKCPDVAASAATAQSASGPVHLARRRGAA